MVKNPSKSKTQNKTAPADGRTVDKTAWLRYSIDIKGTTSRSVPRSDYREVTGTGELAVTSLYYLPG